MSNDFQVVTSRKKRRSNLKNQPISDFNTVPSSTVIDEGKCVSRLHEAW